jgi:hypothetical protein
MIFVLSVLLSALVAEAGQAAATDAKCAVASPLVMIDTDLPAVDSAVKANHRLGVVVIGTGSAVLPGPGGKNLAFSGQLEPALTERLPGVAVKVTTRAQPRQTAADQGRALASIIRDIKPALVVWQTGTVDAMRGLDPDDFREALDAGVGRLRGAGIDVILMNIQFSPRTESIIPVSSYAEAMRWVAQHRGVPLFDRFAVMRQWNEFGIFDLTASTKNITTATQVHDCIAQLLADMIVEGAKLVSSPKTIQ